jgi:hypothetical protein
MNHKRVNIEGGFLALPNTLVDRILKSDISVEVKVLLLCVRWTIGYGKEICTPSLTDLERETGHKRKFISRVVKNLVAKGFLEQVAPAGWREKAKYRVPLKWDSPTIVGQSEPCLHGANTVQQSHGNGTGYPTGMGLGIPQQCPEQSHKNGTHTYISSIKNSSIEDANHKPPLKVPPGDIVDSAEKRATDLPSLSKSLNASKGEKPDIRPLIRWFEEEQHKPANLNEVQSEEFEALLAGCNQRLFQVAFIKNMKKIAGASVPDHLQGPGQVFMAIAKAAAHQANGGRAWSD